MRKEERNKKICDTMQILWTSLNSHMGDTYSPLSKKVDPKVRSHVGSRKFHVETIQEYAEGIKLLADSLE